VTWKPSEANKNKLEDKRKKQAEKKVEKAKLKNNLNKVPPRCKKRIGDLCEL
jgi:hypothetical protein